MLPPGLEDREQVLLAVSVTSTEDEERTNLDQNPADSRGDHHEEELQPGCSIDPGSPIVQSLVGPPAFGADRGGVRRERLEVVAAARAGPDVAYRRLPFHEHLLQEPDERDREEDEDVDQCPLDERRPQCGRELAESNFTFERLTGDHREHSREHVDGHRGAGNDAGSKADPVPDLERPRDERLLQASLKSATAADQADEAAVEQDAEEHRGRRGFVRGQSKDKTRGSRDVRDHHPEDASSERRAGREANRRFGGSRRRRERRWGRG